MYSDISLTNHLQTSSSVNVKSKVIAEWNLNTYETIQAVGNYKNRPSSASLDANTAPNTVWNPNENDATSNTNQWYGYTDYDTTIDGGYTDEGSIPVTFRVSKDRQKSLMSLEDCFNRFRPRSGINKLRFFGKGKSIIPVSSFGNIFLNPRYYAASKDDKFKYWSSYRTTVEKINGVDVTAEYGISGVVSGNDKLIHDAAPFVIYKNLVPTNKIVLKIQTNVGPNNSLPTANADPFFSGSTPNYKSTPLIWKIQKYTGAEWKDMKTFETDVFSEDGYLQLSYGITNIPSKYSNSFKLLGYVAELPAASTLSSIDIGKAYIVRTSNTDKGVLRIWNGSSWDTAITPTYGWDKSVESITNSQQFVTELDKTLAPSYTENSSTVYREFEYIKGLRIVVTSMLNTNTVFDLIELSPRLEVDLTDNVSTFSIKKFASDIGNSNLPVGQLLSSTGEITIFDNNQVFNKNNLNSLLNINSSTTLINKGLQIKFYEIVSNVPQEFSIISKSPQPTGTTNISITTENPHGIVSNDTVLVSGVQPLGYNGVWTAQSGTSGTTLILNIGSNPGNITKSGTAIKSNANYKDYYIPIKVMYSDGFPQYLDGSREVSMSLRDLNFHFESFLAPEIMLRNASLSFIVATLLDSIGFSNYKFLRASNTNEPVIPYFMVPPNKNVMEILQDLAIATQSAMFFDELNNFVVMSKEYLLPSGNTRSKNINLYGSDDDARKANILELNSESDDIYNDGKIVHYNRYIRKKPNNIQTLSQLDKDQVFEYQRVVFWSLESQEQQTKSKNEEDNTQSGYPLSAIPLAKTLDTSLPVVVLKNSEPVIENNIIEFGDGVYWLGRYNGYFYSNGEIIKYDAVEYAYGSADSTGTIWITSNDDYQLYFSKINKGDKMYQTGRVRIYAEPSYDSNGKYKIGPIEKHGRAQFGTKVAEHRVDSPSTTSWWENEKNSLPVLYKQFFPKSANVDFDKNKDNIRELKPKTETIVKNFLGTQTYSTKNKRPQYKDTIQTSGLVLTGPGFKQAENGLATISYVKKALSNDIDYDTFGARIRFLADKTNNPDFFKFYSSYPAYDFNDSNIGYLKNDNTVVRGPSKLGAQSGGIAIMTNSKGEGYYYEIISLDYTNSSVLKGQAELNTLFFYKLKLNNTTNILEPEILYSDFRNILPDTGKFLLKPENTREDFTYDLGISVSKNNNNSWIFTLYLDNEQLVLFEDTKPMTNLTNSMSLFVRGSSQLICENIFAMRRFLTKAEMTVTVNSQLTNAEKEKIAYTLGSFPNSTKVFSDVTIPGVPSNKYGLSPLVQTGFLSKLSTSSIPESEIWYEEFGAIMRECAYFNVKFDKAYPALTSIINPVPAFLGGYRVAGYTSTPYRAEFLVFNITDATLDLGANKGYADSLNITGVTFTESLARELTVDEFLTDKSDYNEKVNYNPVDYKNKYTDIKNNRLLYGTKSFVIDSPYIQSQDSAYDIMNFVINRVSKPRKAVGVSVFGLPIIQLGDIVGFYYDNTKTLPNTVTNNNFVVYASEYRRDSSGVGNMLYLSEVV